MTTLYVCVECGTLGPRDAIRGNCGSGNAHGRLIRVRKVVPAAQNPLPPAILSAEDIRARTLTADLIPPMERCADDGIPVVECEGCAIDGRCAARWGTQ